MSILIQNPYVSQDIQTMERLNAMGAFTDSLATTCTLCISNLGPKKTPIRIKNNCKSIPADRLDREENNEQTMRELLEKSLLFKGDGDRAVNPLTALENYFTAIKVFIKQVPKYSLEECDFFLDWKFQFSEAEKSKIKSHLGAIFLSCSQLYFKMQDYLKAYYFGKFSRWFDPQSLEGKLRILEAMIELGYLYEALETIEQLRMNELCSGCSEYLNELEDKAKESIRILSCGSTVIDILSETIIWPYEKCFRGPIELFDSPGKGRGYRATQNIFKGETLLIERGLISTGEMDEIIADMLQS